MDDEMEPQELQRNQARAAIARFTISVMPALAGALLATFHLRHPIVGPRHEIALYAACIGLLVISLTISLHYTLERMDRRICDRSDRVRRELFEEVDALRVAVRQLAEDERCRHEKIRKSQRGGHRKMATIEQQILAVGDAFVQTGITPTRALNSRSL